MIIAGFQPFSLLDYPGKTCSIVFTQGCAFRCAYCHNPDLISSRATSTVSEESIFTYLREHRNMIDGVCITGGEPTLQSDLRGFMEKLKELGLLVKLDTNGILPSVVREFAESRLVDFFAMDLKHRWEKYTDVTRVGNETTTENCRQSFQIIQNSGIAHEFRTTVYSGFHTEEDLLDIASWLRPGESYALQAIRYQHMLQPDLPPRPALDLEHVAERIRSSFPGVEVSVRS